MTKKLTRKVTPLAIALTIAEDKEFVEVVFNDECGNRLNAMVTAIDKDSNLKLHGTIINDVEFHHEINWHSEDIISITLY